MNLIKRIILVLVSCGTLLGSAAYAMQKPGQPMPAQPMGPPMQTESGSFLPFGPGGPEISKEEFESLTKEVETFFKNMSDEELAEFVKFVDDIESGKVDINELLPPGMMQPPVGPQQRPQPVAPKSEIKPTPEAPAKPAAPALRNKANAEKMIKGILDHLDSIRSKAEGYELVADNLKPWNKKLDDLTYYLHVITDKNHVEQLVTDKELLTLHDTLKDLNDSLNVQEPLLQVPEFGLGKQDAATKERSKKALKNIISSFETAFTRKSVITNLELLMKKYEPELLKKRKGAEEAQERAVKSAEARKGQQPAPAHVRTEGQGRGGKGFYDQYYSPRRPTSSESSRYEPGYRESRPLGEAVEKPAGEKKPETKYGKPKKKEEEAKKKAEAELKKGEAAKKEEPKAPAAPYAPTTENEKNALKYIEKMAKSFVIIENKLDEDVLVDSEQYFSTDAPTEPRQAQTQAIQTAQAMNENLAELARALHRIARDKSLAEGSIRKSPKAARPHLTKQLQDTLAVNQDQLHALYSQGFTLLQNATQPVAGTRLNNKIALHLGHAEGSTPQYQNARCNSLLRYLEAYEQAYHPSEEAERITLSNALQTIGGPEEAVEAEGEEAEPNACPIL
jgi:hypothetical protein